MGMMMPESTLSHQEAGPLPERRQWPSLLLAMGRERVIAAAAGTGVGDRVSPLNRTRHGLGMLRVREGVLGDVFNLGEFSLSEAAVRLRTDDGEHADGGAAVLADDDELAESIAVLDAVMVASDRSGASDAERSRAEPVRALLREAGEKRAEADRLRGAMLGATKVDFALLNQDTEHLSKRASDDGAGGAGSSNGRAGA